MSDDIEISDPKFLRQLDIIKPEELHRPITVIGCGGIGSPLVFMLAKLGCDNITVYDNDVVQVHNLPNQQFREKDLGEPKVKAIKEIVKEFTGVDIVAKNELYVNQPLNGIVISGVDKMEIRQKIWKQVKMKPGIRFYIDARMGGELARIYLVNPMDPDDCEFYEENLYSDKEGEELPCTARSIIYTVYGLTSIIGVLIKKKIKGEEVPKETIIDFSRPEIFTS
jgi:hypothetical protein